MPLSGIRVLIVEDDLLIGELIGEVIRDAGGEIVGPFATMIEALEQLDDLRAIDCAILDVGLSGEFSYPLAEALQTTRIPFLFLTGFTRRDLPERFAAVPHLGKPFLPAALIQAIVALRAAR